MRLLWITDPHLDHLRLPEASFRFGEYIRKEEEFDAVVITGDIAEAISFEKKLTEFAEGVAAPVYFVLGNHDYYKGSVDEVDQCAKDLSDDVENLTWLDQEEAVILDDKTALVGCGGWYDASTGTPEDSPLVMSDWLLIEDFRALTNQYDLMTGVRKPIIDKARELAQEASARAKVQLEAALLLRDEVIFATHYPPFPESCWHEGGLSDDDWSPWFTSVTMGNVLAEVAAANLDKRIIVLCGHTHSPGFYQHSDNLVVLTGSSQYGVPRVSQVFELPVVWSVATYGWAL